MHAEINTLYKFLKTKNIYDIKKKTKLANNGVIYVVRLMNEQEGKCDHFPFLLGNSRPCDRCQLFLHKHNVKKIKYTNIINGVNVLCEMKIK